MQHINDERGSMLYALDTPFSATGANIIRPELLPGASDITNEQYHEDTSHISCSGIKLINKSPAHYYAAYLDPHREPRKKTDTLKAGTAIHAAILEPHDFERLYTVLPHTAPKRPTSVQLGAKKPSAETIKAISYYERFDADNVGVEILSADDFTTYARCRDSVYSHRTARELLSDIYVEQSFFYKDPETGAPCKIRPDAVSVKHRLALDIKSAEDASPSGFTRAIAKYDYHIQDPFYTDGLRANGIDVDGFVFIAVEKVAPYAVGIYHVDATGANLGRELYLQGLAAYMACIQSGKWDSYNESITQLTLPQYAYNK